MAKFIRKDRMNISRKARHALGKLSALLALRSVDTITSDRARELCAELYLAIDSIVEEIEVAERRDKENGKRKENN